MTTSVEEENYSMLQIDNYSLSQNYPNPFNSETRINYHLPLNSHVSLRIFNIHGRMVRTLINETKSQGDYFVTWDGKNESGIQVSSGVYFYMIKAGNFLKTKKLLVIQ